jgi:multidrug efflux pump subunit AcrB
MEIVGELKEQIKGQLQSLTVVITSVLAIYLALVFQFNNAIKPLIVFAAIPFGAVGVLGGRLADEHADRIHGDSSASQASSGSS